MAITADQVRQALTNQSLQVERPNVASNVLGGVQLGQQVAWQVQQQQMLNQKQSQMQAESQEKQRIAGMKNAQVRNQGAFLVNQQLVSGMTPEMTDQEKQMVFQKNMASITPDALAQFGLSAEDLQDDIAGFSTNPTQAFNNINSEIEAGKLQFTKGDSKTTSKIREETRGVVRGQLKDVSKQSSVIRDNYSKLKNLIAQIKTKGNRSAVGQALIAIAKLGDPSSVVSKTEADAVQNAERPIAAAIALFKSKGDADSERLMRSLERSFDPQNPNLINTDELMATGQALVSAAVPSIQARYAEAREQSEPLTEFGRESLFTKGLESRVRGLGDLLAGEEVKQTEDAKDFANIEDLL